MKISEMWLREWVNPGAVGAQELAALLTMAGLEVDSVNDVAGAFDRVIVAHVKKTKPHPQADKLTLCEVDTGQEILQVVCGASNVRPDLKVALAQMGATLPGDFAIKESTLRGELSQGMLCSFSELGLADSSEGIIELPKDAPIGTDLRDYLLLNDSVLDIDLTPNRADCMSVLGVARELAAITKQPLQTISKEKIKPSIDETISITLESPEACPQYCGRIIRDIDPAAETPVWMSERLRRAGLRCIHPVVDVTNYVMLELGQPMHAFDLQKLQGGIYVRYAKPSETLQLLDGQEITLHDKVLLISDQEKALAMAGIMGGNDSSVSELTNDIFLESAFFTPHTIAGVARNFGLCTDSSQRFERGVDPGIQNLALERATALLLEIVGGKAGPLLCTVEQNNLPKNNTVLLKPSQVKRYTGMSIDEAEMVQMLQGLGMYVDKSATPWQVTVPTHRFDISMEADLIEEIIRLYGYHKMQGEPMISTIQAGTINSYESIAMKAAQFFVSRGYHETISYSFVDPEIQQTLYPQAQALELLNPISSELSVMRAGMWPGLMASMIYNIHRQQTAIKFFENGVVFEWLNGNLQEHPCIAGLISGEQGSLNWSEKVRAFDFFDMKGDLLAFFSSLGLQNTEFTKTENPALHPGKSASIHINDQYAGLCGVLHPRIGDALDLPGEVILFELRLDALNDKTTQKYQPISKFPQIRRDLSFLLNEEYSAAQIEEAVRKVVNRELLKAFYVFDVYQGESIPKGKKSLAIALTLQDDKRTLIDNEINAIIDAIIKKLDEEFSIILRD